MEVNPDATQKASQVGYRERYILSGSLCFRKIRLMISNMNTISMTDILALPIQERIRLVELIRDSVTAVISMMMNTPETLTTW